MEVAVSTHNMSLNGSEIHRVEQVFFCKDMHSNMEITLVD